MEYSLSSSDSPRGLRATLNPLCTEPLNEFFVQGLFGVRQAPNKECIYLQSSTQHFTDSNEIFIEVDLTLEPAAYEYCAEAILNGREKPIVDGRQLGGMASGRLALTLLLFVDRYLCRRVRNSDCRFPSWCCCRHSHSPSSSASGCGHWSGCGMVGSEACH